MFSDIPGRTVSLNVSGDSTTPISPSLSTENTASNNTSDTHDNTFVSDMMNHSDEQPVNNEDNTSDEEEDDSDEGGIETKTETENSATEEPDKTDSVNEEDVSDEDENEEEEEEDEEEEEKEAVGEDVEETPEETPEETDVVEDDTDEPGKVEDGEDVEDVEDGEDGEDGEEKEAEEATRPPPDTIDAHLASLRNELEQLHTHTQTIDKQSELQDEDMVTLDITLDRMNDKLESACACANGRYNKDLNTCQVDVTEKMLRLVKAVVSKPTNTPDTARKQEAFARHAPAFVYSDPSVRESMVKPLAEKLFTVLMSGDDPMVNTRITAVRVPLSQRSRLSRRRRPSCCSGASPFQRAMQSLSTGCDRQCSCRSRNGPANNIPTYTLPSVSPTSLSSSPAQPASPVWIVRSIPSAISSSAMPSSASSVSASSRARRRSFKSKSKSNSKSSRNRKSVSKSKSNRKRVSKRRSSATSSSVARKPSRSPGRSTTTKRKRRVSQRGGSIRAHSRMIPAAGTVPNVRYVMDAQGSAPVAMTPAVQGGQTFVFPATATPACAVPTMYPATMTANTVPTAIQQTGGGNGNGSRPLMDVQGQYGCTSAVQQGGQVMVFPTTATPVCAVPGQCGGPVGVRGGGGRRRRGAASSRRSRRFKT